MFQPSPIPLGPFAQFGEALSGVGQQMGQWAPVVMQAMQMKEHQATLKRQEASQDWNQMQTTLQMWPNMDPTAKEDLLKSFHAKHPDWYMPTVPQGAPATGQPPSAAGPPPGMTGSEFTAMPPTPAAAGPIAQLPIGQRPGDIALPPTDYRQQTVGTRYANDPRMMGILTQKFGPDAKNWTMGQLEADPVGAELLKAEAGQTAYQLMGAGGVGGGKMPTTLGEFAQQYGIPLRKGVDPRLLNMQVPVTSNYLPDYGKAISDLRNAGFLNQLPSTADLLKQYHSYLSATVSQVQNIDREIQSAGRDNYRAVPGLIRRRDALIQKARQELGQQAKDLQGYATVDTGLLDSAAQPYSKQDIQDMTYGGREKEARAKETEAIALARLGIAQAAGARAARGLQIREDEYALQVARWNEHTPPGASMAMRQLQTDLNHAAPGSAEAQQAASMLTNLRTQYGVGFRDAQGNFHVVPAVADPAGTSQSLAQVLQKTTIPNLERRSEGARAVINGYQRQIDQLTADTSLDPTVKATQMQRLQNSLLGAQAQFNATSQELATARQQLRTEQMRPTTPPATTQQTPPSGQQQQLPAGARLATVRTPGRYFGQRVRVDKDGSVYLLSTGQRIQ